VTRPLVAIAAAVIGGSLYLPTLDNPFFYDDFRTVVENRSILNLQNLPGVISGDLTRPLVNLSYAVDATVWGPLPFGFHVTSVVLHMLNVALICLLAWVLADDRRRQHGQLVATTGSTIIAVGAAVVFAVHPVMTQAVGYISGRSETLYLTFFVGAFLSARRWMIGGGAPWWWAAAAAWVLAVLAKETAVMLAPLLLCYDRLLLSAEPKARRHRTMRLHLPLFAATTVLGLVRLALLRQVEYPNQGAIDWRFALVALEVPWRYLSLLAVPQGQAVFHDVPLIEGLLTPRGVAVVASLAGLLALVWRLVRIHSLVAFGVAWFLLLLVPPGVLFVMGRGDPMAEHRVYGASVGVFLAAGSMFGLLVQRAARRGHGALAIVVALSIAYAAGLYGRTLVRNAIWDDPVVLASEAVMRAPDHWLPHMLRGEALRTTGRCDEAIVEYRIAIERRPTEEFGYPKLAACLLAIGRLDDAAEAFDAMATTIPESADARVGQALVAVLRDQPDIARVHLVAALGLQHDDARAQQLLDLVTGELAKPETAQMCEELVRLSPAGPRLSMCKHAIASDPATGVGIGK
jgi:hypothetical protein